MNPDEYTRNKKVPVLAPKDFLSSKSGLILIKIKWLSLLYPSFTDSAETICRKSETVAVRYSNLLGVFC